MIERLLKADQFPMTGWGRVIGAFVFHARDHLVKSQVGIPRSLKIDHSFSIKYMIFGKKIPDDGAPDLGSIQRFQEDLHARHDTAD